MKKVAAAVMTAAMVLPVLTGCGVQMEMPEAETSETTVKELGEANLKDDYFRYVNQDRFDITKIKYGEQSFDLAFNNELIDDQIESVIDDIAAGSGYAKGSEEDVIKHAYDYYKAYNFETEPIPENLLEVLGRLDKVTTVDELLELDAELVRDYGVASLINVSDSINPFDPTERVMEFGQIQNVLDASFVDMREDNYALNYVKKTVQVILSTRGYDKESAEQYGKELAFVALDLFSATDLDIAEDDMIYKYQKIVPASEINGYMSNVDLEKYLKTIGYDTSKVKSYCVTDIDQLKALNAVFTDDNINALTAWEICNVYNRFMKYIAPHYEQLNSYVGRNYAPEHDQIIDEISETFFKETDPIYVERFYLPETDTALRNMCDDIRAGYRDLIGSASWLSEGTRTELLKKLDNIAYITATDLKRHDNSRFADIYGDNYYELRVNYSRVLKQKSIEDFNNGLPVSRTESDMPMQMMNACYQPSANTITITAAITNAPFFDKDADYYTNLGGLGAVIAHEMGHAFDSNCILFNSKGEYDPSWIAQADMDALTERNEKAAKYFEDNFTVFGIYHVDGEQTLGENYADLGGVECICTLAKTKEDRIKLFESYATIWCEIAADDVIIDQIAYDPHSPSYIRVNAILSTVDDFYETYDISEVDGMYIAPEERISRWY